MWRQSSTGLQSARGRENLHPTLRGEIDIAVASLKKGKSTGVDTIPAELVQAGAETMIYVKEDRICAQCEEIETCLKKNNYKTAYQLVMDLTSEKQGSPQLSRTSLGNVLLKNKRFSADGQRSLTGSREQENGLPH